LIDSTLTIRILYNAIHYNNNQDELMMTDGQYTQSALASETDAVHLDEPGDTTAGFCLFELVEDIIHRHQTLLSANRARLVCNIHPDLPSRMILDMNRVQTILDDLTHFCVKYCMDGEIHIQFSCSPFDDLQDSQKMSVEINILDADGEPDVRHLRLFNQQVLHTRETIRLLGGSIPQDLSDQQRGLSFTLSYQTVTHEFQLHNRPESVILILDADPASASALLRILGEITPNIQHLSDHHELEQMLGMADSISLLVVGLSERGQGKRAEDESLLHHLVGMRAIQHIPVLALLDPRLTPPMPVNWKRLGKPIRKKGLLRVANQLIRQHLETQQQQQTRHVLVAEDNEINLKVISKLLNHHRIDYSIATSGAMAVRLFAERQVDLILMDIHMPGMDGIEATRQIRQLSEQGAKVPVIAMTADTLHETRLRCKEVGINDALIKPLELEDIQICLMSWLYDDDHPAPAAAITCKPITDMRTELHDMLLSMLPDYRQQLMTFASNDDLIGLSETAHALAGAACYCGTDDLKQASIDLEAAINAGTNSDFKPALEHLMWAIRQLLD
jgi:CheY-like chemotaxis protein